MGRGPTRRGTASLRLNQTSLLEKDAEGRLVRVPAVFDRDGNERDDWVADDGQLDPAAFPDEIVFHVESACWILTGLSEGKHPNIYRLRSRLEHPHCAGTPIYDRNGTLIAFATTCSSLHAYAEWDRESQQQRMRAGVNADELYPLDGAIGEQYLRAGEDPGLIRLSGAIEADQGDT